MDNNTVLFLISIVLCFIALAGWLSKRDTKIVSGAEWRGAINAKLDMILSVFTELEKVSTQVEENTIQIALLDSSNTELHQRVDRHKEFCNKQQELKDHFKGDE